ncbi:hypothetical protein COSO111634_18035 [Corallococcus soli]
MRAVMREIWLSNPVARMPHPDTITAGVTAVPMSWMEEKSRPSVTPFMPPLLSHRPAGRHPAPS